MLSQESGFHEKMTTGELVSENGGNQVVFSELSRRTDLVKGENMASMRN